MRWEELSWPKHKEMVEAGATVVLPFASIEQHGPHAPVGVDTFLVSEVCGKAVEGLENVLLAPTMWAGFAVHHLTHPGTFSLSLHTYISLVQELVRSAASHGYKKFLLVNGHGGNHQSIQAALNPLRQELGIDVWMVTYFHLGNEIAGEIRVSEIGGMAHSGEFETAMMMHLRPELIDLSEAVKNPSRPVHPLMTRDMHHRGILFRPPDFHRDRNPSGVTGDPAAANAENGARYFEAVAARLREIIQSLAAL
ncbi:MAG: creatininase family protein [Nitrospinota bacterium]|nr:creatininase family protein [Nitrospinota bacterium]